MVAYLRFPPPPEQHDVVEHYWMVEGEGVADQILIPNGRPALAIALGTPGHRHDPVTGSTWLNDGSLFGVMTRPHVLSQSGPSSYVGVELRPWGIAALTSQQLVDQVLPIDAWAGDGATERLAERLREVEFGQARAATLADWLAPRLRPVDFVVAERAVRLIEDSRGTLPVATLSRALDVPYSTLHRRFRDLVGVGPKQFGEIVRFFHFTGGLLDGPADGAAVLAALHGYYDQAHAARDFKRYTGVSASSFRRMSHGIAALMHESSVQDPPGGEQAR
ncbi:helix-turn-helix domain-containing protein [Kribbella italica]|uniref:AraC-like DNA-binding protein n=1 Tax=Kribbella italica TaxID=1540520 RepID=A0A7W9MVP4_9ACTN|nr:AraC-like DNA-binding protein [Kribbella italica]